MKVIMTVDFPDEVVYREGITVEDVEAIFTDMQEEIKQGVPEGTMVSFTIVE